MSASCERSTTEIGNLPDGSFCVAVASRPRVEELAEFLAFEVRPIPKFREDWRLEDPVGAVLSTCSTLLAVVNIIDDFPTLFSSRFSVLLK